jgi:hypothetical protein
MQSTYNYKGKWNKTKTPQRLARTPRFSPVLYERRNDETVFGRTPQSHEAQNVLHSLQERGRETVHD